MQDEQKSGRNARFAEQKNTFELYICADKRDSSGDRNLNEGL